MAKIVKKIRPRTLTLQEICDRRKKILIRRNVGGLGDIMMHRMIFEDFKLLMPDCELTFALPLIYHPAVIDHPFIDKVIDCKELDESQFLIHYSTTSVCARYELRAAPYCYKHRSDIWAEHCGVSLTRHNMHINLSKDEKDWAKSYLADRSNGKKTVVISPISAMVNKNLEPEQANPFIDALSDYKVFTLHTSKIDMNAECIYGISTREWMGIIDAADYIVSVDTSTYHCAGGMGKPVVGIFGWADSKVYSKFYPRAVLVQKHREDDPSWTCGPCYNFFKCPKCSEDIVRKPCITEITWKDVLNGFDKMVEKYPR